MVNLTLMNAEGKVDLEGYQENAEWVLLSATGKRNAIEYDCCPGTKYIDVTFEFSIRRNIERDIY